MQRFFFPDLKTTNYTMNLTDVDIFHQLVKVIRIQVWEKIIFFDWNDSYDYIFEIRQINKKDLVLEQIWRENKNSETNFELNLYQSIPNKMEKIEYILQKWVEIWIKNFVFYRSNRSQKLIISETKQERLNKIIIEAVEQSGRNYIPELVILDKFDILLLKDDENIFFHTQWEKSLLLKELVLDYSKNINLFVWPEWWFSDDEIINFNKINWKKVFLWNRILRTETTGIVWGFYIIQSK